MRLRGRLLPDVAVAKRRAARPDSFRVSFKLWQAEEALAWMRPDALVVQPNRLAADMAANDLGSTGISHD